MTRPMRTLFIAAAAFAPALVPTIAFAHPGHTEHSGFVAGLGHPFIGVDHLLALAAVGMLAGRLEVRAMAVLLGAWMCSLVTGMLAGVAGIDLPSVQPLLIVSIGISALLAVLPKAPSRGLVGGIIALATFFAFFHGFAHGERALATSASAGFVAAGFVAGIATASALVLALAAAFTRFGWPAVTAGAAR